MYPCNFCFENIWKFKSVDNWIIATCQSCGKEIEFKSTQQRPKHISKTGDKCKKCNNPVILRETRKKLKQLKKSYYYTAYFYCTKCRTMYFDDRFKVVNNYKDNNNL